jgi:DNA-3-methyladenine glycosylase II
MSIFDTHFLEKGTSHLASIDAALAKIIQQVGPLQLRKCHGDDFMALCSIIVSQQLSAKSAITIFERLQKLCEAERDFSPECLRKINLQKFKECGVSSQKIRSIYAVAAAYEESPFLFQNIYGMHSNDAINALTSLHGIGPWTANIFLLSQHGRGDTFPLGDNTLRSAMKKIYDVDEDMLNHITQSWRPYRSIAAQYLWAWVDLRKVK